MRLDTTDRVGDSDDGAPIAVLQGVLMPRTQTKPRAPLPACWSGKPIAGLLAAPLLLSVACSSGPGARSTIALTPSDFVDADAPYASPRPLGTVAASPAPIDRTVVALQGAPDLGASDAQTTGLLQVDQMVGQVNGVPIYANEFLSDLEARLTAEAARVAEGAITRRQWITDAAGAIEAQLIDEIRNQLVLDEFRSSMPPEQRAGLRFFLEQLRSDLVRENRGSVALANERSLATEGVGINEQTKNILEEEMIRQQLRQELGSTAIVTPQDVRRAYRANIDRYAPPAKATFRVLSVPSSDAESVQQRLAAGEAFSDLATEDLNRWPGQGRIERTGKFAPDAPAGDLELFGAEALNAAVAGLTVGERTERIDLGERAYWVSFEALDAPKAKTLYEAQLEIENELRTAAIEEASAKYFARLLEEASITRISTMRERLITFAVDRYLGATGR